MRKGGSQRFGTLLFIPLLFNDDDDVACISGRVTSSLWGPIQAPCYFSGTIHVLSMLGLEPTTFCFSHQPANILSYHHHPL